MTDASSWPPGPAASPPGERSHARVFTRGRAGTLLVAAVALLSVLLIAWPTSIARAGGGLVRTTTPSPEDPGPPLYARVGDPAGPVVYSDGDWAVIAFYRDPDCVPEDFNLLEFFAFGSFGCDMTVSGFSLWEVEVGTAPPKVLKMTGTDVPIWFSPLDAFNSAIADGVLTVGELQGLDGLLVGHADRFNETLQPIPLPPELGGGGHPSPKLVQQAGGWLQDGRRFSLHISHVHQEVRSVRIRFQ